MGIKVKDIVKTYNKGTDIEVNVLKKISLEIDDGDMVAIIGRSGAGKSTLMHILGLIDEQTSGSYYLDDIDVAGMKDKRRAIIRNSKIGFILQDFGLVEDETVLDNVMLPMMLNDTKIKDMKSKARNILNKLEISKLEDKYVEELSGGEKQRVAMARALVNDPKYIFADEPTGALDSKNAMMLLELLKKLNSEGRTVILITHDMTVAEQCKRIIKLDDGKMI